MFSFEFGFVDAFVQESVYNLNNADAVQVSQMNPYFDASLFVSFRKHLGLDVVNEINEKIIAIKTKLKKIQTRIRMI